MPFIKLINTCRFLVLFISQILSLILKELLFFWVYIVYKAYKFQVVNSESIAALIIIDHVWLEKWLAYASVAGILLFVFFNILSSVL